MSISRAIGVDGSSPAITRRRVSSPGAAAARPGMVSGSSHVIVRERSAMRAVYRPIAEGAPESLGPEPR